MDSEKSVSQFEKRGAISSDFLLGGISQCAGGGDGDGASGGGYGLHDRAGGDF